jgi:predicted MFS family arabinose efflux permease
MRSPARRSTPLSRRRCPRPTCRAPFFAGAIMATVGPIACFATNAVTYAPYLLAIYLVRIPSTATRRPEVGSRGRRARASILEAARAIVQKRGLRSALLTVAITSLFGIPTITFMPVLVRDAFHLGTAAFGGALSVFGLGGLIGAAAVLPLATNRSRRLLSSAAALVLAAAIVGMALDRVFGALLVLVFVAGAAMVASNTAANSILQSSIDGRLRGRVSSMYTLALRGGAPIGSLVTGLVASRWGVRTALLVNGALALLCHSALQIWSRRNSSAKKAA